MPKRTLLSALVVALGLLAAACGSHPHTATAINAGFLPQKADFLDQVGINPSIAVDEKGDPHVAYIGIPEKLAKGEIPVSRPLGAPVVPGVLTATLDNGLWMHGATVQSTTGTDAKTIPVNADDAAAIAVDPDGVSHVVWTEKTGLFYADDKQQPGTFGQPQEITKSVAKGPSIALDGSTPWVAYYQGTTVFVATPAKKGWTQTKVATVSGCAGCPTVRTAIAVGDNGPVVAFTDGGKKTPMAAMLSGGKWKVSPIEPGVGGFGISLALGEAGGPLVAYYNTGGEVDLATSSGATWSVQRIARFRAAKGSTAGWTTGLGVDKKGQIYATWYDPSADTVRLAKSSGDGFQEVSTTDTQGGDTPALAVDSDGTAFVAWYDHQNQDLWVGQYPAPQSFVLAVPTAGPTGSGAPSLPTANCKPGPTDIKVVAKELAFDTQCLAAPAKKPVTITLDNQDAGIPHNLEIYKDSSATTRLGGATSAADTITGPASTTYKVSGLPPGTYYFQCDVHSTVPAMTGAFVVK